MKVLCPEWESERVITCGGYSQIPEGSLGY